MYSTSWHVLGVEEGNLYAAGDITVDDAEISMAGGDTYLAATDTDLDDNFGADSLAEDMIS